MGDAELSGVLASAGVELLGDVDMVVPLIPPELATFAGDCSGGVGLLFASVEVDDPQLVDHFNDVWYQTCLEAGLFGPEDGHFLLGARRMVSGERAWWWVRVRLLSQWDLVTAGSPALGPAPGHPSFVLLSLDGRVTVRVDEAETALCVTAVRDPRRLTALRDHAQFMIDWPSTSEATRTGLGRWLADTAS